MALSEEHDRRRFIEQFVRENPGITHSAVIDAMAKAAAKIGPSLDREKLKQAVKEVIGAQDR